MPNYIIGTDGELYHHGIKGQRWGVRRYQNRDGSLTVAGKNRYGTPNRAKGGPYEEQRRLEDRLNKKDGPYKEQRRLEDRLNKKGGAKEEGGLTRVVRGHAGPGRYIGKQRQLDGYKRDLELLDKGGHLSYGATKKRQAELDKRDRETLVKKIARLEAEGKADRAKGDAETARKLVDKYVDAMDKKAAKRESDVQKSAAADRARRAKEESDTTRKMVDKYVDAMDKKAAKRAEQAQGKSPTSAAAGRARRAKEEAESARKLGDAYTNAMDKKVAKREADVQKSAAADRARRAKEEAESARKLGDAYTNAMDKKAAKREEEARRRRYN